MVCTRKIVVLAAMVGLVTLSCVPFASADVGYSMRGDTRPFHNWDSAFNLSASENDDNGTDGVVWDSDSFTFRPHVGMSVGYDDNVYLKPDNEIDDTYWSVAPGIMLIYGQEDDDYLSLNYEYEITKYTDEDVLDYDSHLLSAGVRLTPGLLDVHLSDQYTDSIDVNPETAKRTAREQNSEMLTISRFVSKKTTVVAEQRYDINNYKDDLYLDYDELWFGGWLYHRTFPKVSTFVGAGYGIVNMTDAGVWGDSDYFDCAFGAQGRVTAKTTVHARLGWEDREFEDDIDSIQDWTCLIGVSSRFSNRTYWGVDVSRSLNPSSSRAGYTRIPTVIMPSIRHILWKDSLSVSVSGAYELADYYGHHGEAQRDDKYWYITGVLDWHPQNLLTVGAGFTHAEQTSDIDEDEYSDNRMFFRAMLNY